MSNLFIFEEKMKKKKRIINNQFIKSNNSFTSSNLYLKTENNKTNRSQNKSLQKPPYNNNSLKKRIKLAANTSQMKYYNNLSYNQNIQDELFFERNKINREIKQKNIELKLLKNIYDNLKSKYLTNKFIIEKMLNLYDDESKNNLLNKEEKNNIEENMINYKEQIFIDTQRSKNNKIQINNEEKKKCNILKKQINLLNRNINKNNIALNELKNQKSIKIYNCLKNSINNKNEEIKVTMEKIKELNIKLFQNDTKIKFYSLKKMDYIENINKQKEKINIMHKKHLENEKLVKACKEKINQLNNNQQFLEEEIKKNEKEKDVFKEKQKQLNEQIKENDIYIEENEKNKKTLFLLENEKTMLETQINRIKTKNNILNNTNKIFSENLEDYENEKMNILGQSKK